MLESYTCTIHYNWIHFNVTMKHSAVAAVNIILFVIFPTKCRITTDPITVWCTVAFISSHLPSTILWKSSVSVQNCVFVPRDCLPLDFSSLKSISFLKIMESMQCGDIWICGVPLRWRGIDYYSVFTCMVPARGEMAAVCFFFTSAHHDELWQLTSEQPVKESACNEQPACLRDTCQHISNKVILLLSLPLSITHSHAAFSLQMPGANARDAYLRLVYLFVCKQVHLDCT